MEQGQSSRDTCRKKTNTNCEPEIFSVPKTFEYRAGVHRESELIIKQASHQNQQIKKDKS